MPTPVYPEYPALWEQAQRAAQGPVDPGLVRSVEATTRARRVDWCTGVLGRSFAGLRHATAAEAQLLRLADERTLDPPLPDEIATARQQAADHRTLVASQRQQQRDHDRREWTAALGRAGVPAEVLQVRANVRSGGRSAHRGGGPLRHVVPTVDLWSGPDRRPRRHRGRHRQRPVGRAASLVG